jgi:hypothetical protein
MAYYPINREEAKAECSKQIKIKELQIEALTDIIGALNSYKRKSEQLDAYILNHLKNEVKTAHIYYQSYEWKEAKELKFSPSNIYEAGQTISPKENSLSSLKLACSEWLEYLQTTLSDLTNLYIQIDKLADLYDKHAKEIENICNLKGMWVLRESGFRSVR